MANWTEADLDVVRGVVADQLNKQQLTKGQKWEVIILLGALVIGGVALLTFGGRPLVEQISRNHAETVAFKTFTNRVLEDQEFLSQVRGDTAAVPRDAILPFDRSGGCPDGWTKFEDGAGRVLLGEGAGTGLTPRQFRSVPGRETIQLAPKDLPKIVAEAPRSDLTVDVFPSSKTGLVLGDRYPERPAIEVNISGVGEEIEIMPPSIVLYFCKKE